MLDDSVDTLTFAVTLGAAGVSVTAAAVLFSTALLVFRLVASWQRDTCRDTTPSSKIPTTRLHLHDSELGRARNVVISQRVASHR